MNIPGFRRLDDGTIIETRPLLPEGDEPAWLDRPAGDGRTHRCRLEEAARLAAVIADGWRPGDHELHDAPLIDRWIPLVAGDGAVIIGDVFDHPLREDGRSTTTSLLLSLDGHGRWARTISRYFRLGRPLGREDDA